VNPSLLERFRPLLRLQVRRLQLDPRLRRRFDSSDLVQETLTRAVSCADQLRGQTDAEAFCWLQRVLRTVAINTVEREEAQARDFRREFPVDEVLTDSSVRVTSFLASPTPAPDEQAARCELLLRLADGIERLPPEQRDVVNLRDVHGYRVEEIAEFLGKTEKAVAGLLLRGHLKLRELARHLGLEPP
jgi:RNA polymerase sigma-70 factor (ECF subfamily)